MNERNGLVIGIGEFGASVINITRHKSVFVDWRSNIFSSANADFKIKVKKDNCNIFQDLRLQNRLKSALKSVDTAFVAVNTMDFIAADHACQIVEFIKQMGILTVAIALMPPKKERAKNRKHAIDYADTMGLIVPMVAIPYRREYWVDGSEESDVDVFDSLGIYSNNLSVLNSDIGYHNINFKIITRTTGTANETTQVSHTRIASEAIEKVIKMLSLDYINSNGSVAEEVLKEPGKLHIASAHNDIYANDIYLSNVKNRAVAVEGKLAESGVLGTVTSFASKMLLHLILPGNITEYELKYLCEHIPGRSDLKQLELAITADPSLGDMIKAEVIATDTLNNEDIEEIERMSF